MLIFSIPSALKDISNLCLLLKNSKRLQVAPETLFGLEDANSNQYSKAGLNTDQIIEGFITNDIEKAKAKK